MLGDVFADMCFFAGLEIEIGNGKFAGPMFIHIAEEGRGDNMNAAEGIRFVLLRAIDESFRFGLPGLFVYPTTEVGAFFIK